MNVLCVGPAGVDCTTGLGICGAVTATLACVTAAACDAIVAAACDANALLPLLLLLLLLLLLVLLLLLLLLQGVGVCEQVFWWCGAHPM